MRPPLQCGALPQLFGPLPPPSGCIFGLVARLLRDCCVRCAAGGLLRFHFCATVSFTDVLNGSLTSRRGRTTPPQTAATVRFGMSLRPLSDAAFAVGRQRGGENSSPGAQGHLREVSLRARRTKKLRCFGPSCPLSPPTCSHPPPSPNPRLRHAWQWRRRLRRRRRRGTRRGGRGRGGHARGGSCRRRRGRACGQARRAEQKASAASR